MMNTINLNLKLLINYLIKYIHINHQIKGKKIKKFLIIIQKLLHLVMLYLKGISSLAILIKFKNLTLIPTK
jgi:hypothetical protein